MRAMKHDEWETMDFRYPVSVPTMLSSEERHYLYWLGKSVWSGDGVVVEIGPWLGGSTICLGAGMADSGHDAQGKLKVFDNFVWRDFMCQRASLPLRAGESFKPYFEDFTRNYRNIIQSYVSALPDESIEGDHEAASKRFSEENRIPTLDCQFQEPIEIMFIDGAKSWRGIRHLLLVFCQNFISKRTLLVCQDYKYWGTYWIPLMMIKLKEYMEPVHNVRNGTTVAFRLVAEIPKNVLENLEDHISALQTEQTLQELDEASALLESDGDKLGALHVQLGRISLLSHTGNVRGAVEEFKRIQKAWPTLFNIAQLERAREYLRNEKSHNIMRAKRHQLTYFLHRGLGKINKGFLKVLSH